MPRKSWWLLGVIVALFSGWFTASWFTPAARPFVVAIALLAIMISVLTVPRQQLAKFDGVVRLAQMTFYTFTALVLVAAIAFAGVMWHPLGEATGIGLIVMAAAAIAAGAKSLARHFRPAHPILT